MSNKILIVSPHCDDESYGMGGTILKHISNGNEVFILVICAGDINFEHKNKKIIPRSERIQEFNKVLKEYGCSGLVLDFYQESYLDTLPTRMIVNEIENIQDSFHASIWYVPGMSFHQDHRKVFEACSAAARPTRKNIPKEIYSYEHPLYSWNPPIWKFIPQVYEDISQYLDKKIEICSIYESQKREGALSVKHIKEYSIACGTETGSFVAAERFEVVRIMR